MRARQAWCWPVARVGEHDEAVRDETANNLIQKLTSRKPKNMPKVYLPFQIWTRTGLIGDATKATREKGERILEAVVKNIVDFLGRVDKLP